MSTLNSSAGSASRSISTAPTSLLSGSDEEDPTIRFTNPDDLFEVIDRVLGDVLVVKDVSASSFDEIEERRLTRGRKFRWGLYEADTQTLVITIPHGKHERLHGSLYRKITAPFQSEEPEEFWADKYSTTFYSNHPGGGLGEGDSTGGPRSRRPGSDQWPTLVIEAGFTQSLNQLRAKMRWWFFASDHDVKIVLLVKLNEQQSTILIEKWQERPTTVRHGATTTRRAAALQPVLQQEITVTRDTTTTPVSYNVVRGPLELEFSLLFLQNPGPLDENVVISVPFLQLYAARLWEP